MKCNKKATSVRSGFFRLGAGRHGIRYEEPAFPTPTSRPHDPGDAADLSNMGYLDQKIVAQTHLFCTSLCPQHLLIGEKKSTIS